MKRIIKLFAALFLLSSNANASELTYSVGQVWEYKNRPQDSGSLLKIQKIEKIGAGDDEMEVFHISVIGITYADPRGGTESPHLPVSRETLDQSVSKLSGSNAKFPDPSEGIEIWRDAQGGFFSIPVAEIIQIGEDTVAGYFES